MKFSSKRSFPIQPWLERPAFFFPALWCSFLIACTQPVLRPKSQPEPFGVSHVASRPLAPAETKEVMREVGENWLYGDGLGDTALAAGSVVAFPPYAAVLLGNAVLSLSGYEPIWLSDALPEDEREQWSEFYDTVGRAPGRFSAAVAGEEFRTKEVINERYKKILAPRELPRSAQGDIR